MYSRVSSPLRILDLRVLRPIGLNIPDTGPHVKVGAVFRTVWRGRGGEGVCHPA
jgi:hypothetical protein